jgi:hypothetical protein
VYDVRMLTGLFGSEGRVRRRVLENMVMNLLVPFLSLWLYSPIQAVAASMELSVSLELLDQGQSV